MPRYSVSYARPGERPATHVLTAKSDAEARIRFLNLSWVAFTEIAVNNIAPVGERLDPKAEAERLAKESPRPAPQKAQPSPNWEKEVDELTDKIGRLADAAQLCRRNGKHALADAKMAEAKKLAARRDEITKRNKRKK